MLDELVLDAPELEAPVVEETPEVEQPEAVEPETPAVPEAEAPKGDERTLPQWIRNLKAVDPQAFKEAKGQFFGKRALDEKLKDFDLDGVKSWLDETGGRDALVEKLTTLESSATELSQINEAIQQGNPELVKDIAAAAPEAFPKLAQAALQEWAQVDPEGWQYAMSGVMAQTIASNGVPSFLEKMANALEIALEVKGTALGEQKLQQLQQSIQNLQQWANSFGQAKAPERQAPKNDAAQKQLQELQQREQQSYIADFQRRVDEVRDPLVKKELEPYIALAPKDADKLELATDRISREIEKRVMQDKDLQSKVGAFLRNKDTDGAVRLVKAREAAIIADVAAKVGRTIYGAPKPVVAKPAAAPQLRQAQSKPQAKVDPYTEIFNRIQSR